jgi:hypothetical protein
MSTENELCNALEPVPPRTTTWPPPWLVASTLPASAPSTTAPVAAAPSLAEPLPGPDSRDMSAVVPDVSAELLAELHREVHTLMNTTWEIAWAERLRTARYADLDAVRRSIHLMLDLAAERHRAGDAAEFQAWHHFIIRHVCGEFWDAVAARRSVRAEDLEIVAYADGLEP